MTSLSVDKMDAVPQARKAEVAAAASKNNRYKIEKVAEGPKQLELLQRSVSSRKLIQPRTQLAKLSQKQQEVSDLTTAVKADIDQAAKFILNKASVIERQIKSRGSSQPSQRTPRSLSRQSTA